MKKKKGAAFPRPVLKNLAEDIKKLVDSFEGLLFILEIIEELPYELRDDLFEGLSTFYCQEMVVFFRLLGLEYGKASEEIVNHALYKFGLAGMDIEQFPALEGDFYKAYVSATRHTGRVNLDVGWKTSKYNIRMESFSLSYNADGLNSFLIVEDMGIRDFDKDHQVMADMITIDYKECCQLIRDAYNFNRRCITRPALGKFAYQRYLDDAESLTPEQMRSLIRKVSQDLSPRQVVNSYFYALKQQDTGFISSLMDKSYLAQGDLFQGASTNLAPGSFLIEAGIDRVAGTRRRLEIEAHAMTVNERDVVKNRYRFLLSPDDEGLWSIKDIDRISSEAVDPRSQENPFNIKVYCHVYEVVDMEELFDLLDLMENVHEVEEIPYGLHVRVGYNNDPSLGMSFLNGILADLVLNGDEFVIISPDSLVLDQYNETITKSYSHVLRQRGEYHLNLSHAYSYLTGQFAAFDDLARTEAGELLLEEGMRFISARYLVKDRKAVKHWVESIKCRHYKLDDITSLYYQLEPEEEVQFAAEFLLGSNWLTVSTFGERDLAVVRQQFESPLNDVLEFQGLEVREDGLLAVLTADAKKRYPALESEVKELYLSKWYYSRNPSLQGLSPSEASKTEEGSRMLWAMFKKMRELEKRRMMNNKNYRISLNEYIHKVQEKNSAESGLSS